MKINQLTSATPHVSAANQQAFTGRIIVKGKWTEELKDAFFKSPAINELASGNKDVIGRLISKSAPSDDYNHTWGEPLFKLSLEMKSPKSSLKERVKSMLGLSRKVINRYYHSEYGMINIMKNISNKTLNERIANK